MPEKGYSSITVSDEVYERLKRHAEETHRTVPKLIEHLLDRFFPEPREEAGLMLAVSLEEIRLRPRRNKLKGIMSFSIAGVREKLSEMTREQVRGLWQPLDSLYSRVARGMGAAHRGWRLNQLLGKLVIIRKAAEG